MLKLFLVVATRKELNQLIHVVVKASTKDEALVLAKTEWWTFDQFDCYSIEDNDQPRVLITIHNR